MAKNQEKIHRRRNTIIFVLFSILLQNSFSSVIDQFERDGRKLLNQGHTIQAIAAYKKAIQLAEKSNTAKLERLYKKIGEAYLAYGDTNNALVYFKKELEINLIKKTPEKNHIAENYLNVAWALAETGQQAKAISNYKKALKIYNLSGQYQYEGNARSMLALLYAGMEDYERGENQIKIVEKLIEKEANKNALWIGGSYYNFASFYAVQGKFSKAMEYIQRSEKIRRQLNLSLMITKFATAQIFAENKQFKKAIENFQLAKSLLAKNSTKNIALPHESIFLSRFNLGLAKAYNGHKNHNRAAFYAQKALDGVTGKIIKNNTYFGDIYFEFGNIYKDRNPEKAMMWYKKTIALYSNNKILQDKELAAAYYQIALIYESKKNDQQAIKFAQMAKNSAHGQLKRIHYQNLVQRIQSRLDQ